MISNAKFVDNAQWPIRGGSVRDYAMEDVSRIRLYEFMCDNPGIAKGVATVDDLLCDILDIAAQVARAKEWERRKSERDVSDIAAAKFSDTVYEAIGEAGVVCCIPDLLRLFIQALVDGDEMTEAQQTDLVRAVQGAYCAKRDDAENETMDMCDKQNVINEAASDAADILRTAVETTGDYSSVKLALRCLFEVLAANGDLPEALAGTLGVAVDV